VDILLFAEQHDMTDDKKSSIESIDPFKAGREFVSRDDILEQGISK
jgi:hypothetical protein